MSDLGGRNIVEAEVRSKQSNFCAQMMPLKMELLQQEPAFKLLWIWYASSIKKRRLRKKIIIKAADQKIAENFNYGSKHKINIVGCAWL